jgi:hypothetical protein
MFTGAMKRRLLIVLSLAICITAHVRADIIIVQRVEGEGKSGDVTIKIKGPKVRTDFSPEFSVIKNVETGEEFTLAHQQKAFVKVTREATEALRQQREQMRQAAIEPGASPAGKPVLTPTGEKEKIGPHTADVFTIQNGNLQARYWLVAGYPKAASLLAQMKVIEDGPLGDIAKGLLPSVAELPGFPIKTEVTLQEEKTVTTIQSVKEEPVPDNTFAIPADYHELPTPSLPADTE